MRGKRLAQGILVLGLLALGAVVGGRLLGLASAAPALHTSPGEGRLDQTADVFSGLFRSWSLGGRETTTRTQQDAVLRLGTMRDSRLVRLELRRRQLEQTIAEARSYLQAVAGTQAAPENASPAEEMPGEEQEQAEFEGGESTVEPAAPEGEFGEDSPEEPAPPSEESAARASLAALEAEYAKILADLNPEAFARESERLAEIGVLSGGSARGVQLMLARWGQPFRLVSAGAGLAGQVKNLPLLIVPTGALAGRAGRQLAAYVRSGGNLLVFAQRTGVEWRNLPGGLRGYGWLEAESAYGDAVEVAAAHPSTVSCNAPRFSAAVDGFFTAVPPHAEVLLRATQSGCPVAVSYPLGKGLVAATTLFTDWAAMNRLPAGTEYRFVRDLTLWALARGGRLHGAIPQPGTRYEISLPIANDTKEMAAKVRVAYLSPEGAYGTPFDLDLRMLPKDREDRTLRLHAPRSPGVWRLAYALIKPDGSFLQYWRNAVDVAVGSPAVAGKLEGVGLALTCPSETHRRGRPLPLTLHLWNFGPQPCRITVDGPAGRRDLTVQGGKSSQTVLRIPAIREAVGRGFYELNLTWQGQRRTLAKLITVVPEGKEDRR